MSYSKGWVAAHIGASLGGALAVFIIFSAIQRTPPLKDRTALVDDSTFLAKNSDFLAVTKCYEGHPRIVILRDTVAKHKEMLREVMEHEKRHARQYRKYGCDALANMPNGYNKVLLYLRWEIDAYCHGSLPAAYENYGQKREDKYDYAAVYLSILKDRFAPLLTEPVVLAEWKNICDVEPNWLLVR